jgi:hypothetical protein
MRESWSFRKHLTKKSEWVDIHIGPWFGAVILFGGFRFLLQKAAAFHWSVGLSTTLVLTFILASLLWGWRKRLYMKYSPKHSRSDAGALLLTTLLLAIVVFAAVSLLINQVNPRSFTATAPISMGTLTDFYFWVTLDSLPGVRFSETFRVPSPLEHHGPAASICLLTFRLLVLGTLLKALKDWMTSPTAEAKPKLQTGEV